MSTVGFAGFLLLVAIAHQVLQRQVKKSTSVDKGCKSYVEEATKAFEKWRKINIKTGDALGGLDNLSLDNQSKKLQTCGGSSLRPCRWSW